MQNKGTNPMLGWVGDMLIHGGFARLTYPIVHVGGNHSTSNDKVLSSGGFLTQGI